jgi:hypothetical protein
MLGHVIYSPPIELGFGTEQYIQDLAVIEIDLGTEIHPNLQNAHTFEYPDDRLPRLKGSIPDEDAHWTRTVNPALWWSSTAIPLA